jgi:hypothetical protein
VAPDRIDDQLTMGDSSTWTRPWTAVIRLKRSTAQLYVYVRHDGNFEIMRDMFAAARARGQGR